MVSIIVPVYNVERYLEKCISSVLKLKSDIEVLLVDDGSTDASGALCDAWAQKDARIRVIHQENGGLSAARNTGIRNAGGEHVLFLDSDDFLDPTQTDQMLSKLQPETNVLMGFYNEYYTESGVSKPENSEPFLRLEGEVAAGQLLSAAASCTDGCYMTAWRFVCRREFLLEHDLLFLPGIYHEDEEWNARLFCQVEKVTVTHHHFYQYRQARSSSIMSTVKPKHLFDSYTIIERMDQLCRVAADDRKDYLRNRMGRLYLNNMIHHRSLDGQDKKRSLELLKRWRGDCACYMPGTLGRLTAMCVSLLGIGLTCGILAAARRVKHRGKE